MIPMPSIIFGKINGKKNQNLNEIFFFRFIIFVPNLGWKFHMKTYKFNYFYFSIKVWYTANIPTIIMATKPMPIYSIK